MRYYQSLLTDEKWMKNQKGLCMKENPMEHKIADNKENKYKYRYQVILIKVNGADCFKIVNQL